MSAHRIDIICPTYNRSTALLPTIRSVRAQTVDDWNLIVVSDGSTDDTEDVVRAVHDDRIRLLRVGPHGGPGGPRNAGLAAATAPHVAYVDHDDRWEPQHLAVLLEVLESGAPLAATGCVRIDPAGRVQQRSGVLDTVWHPELQVLNAMYEPSRVGHVRQLVTEAGGWSTTAAGFEDWDLWFRLAERGTAFAPTERRTAVLALDDGSRRHTFPPRHAIGIARLTDERQGHRVREVLAQPETRERADACYRADTCSWFEQLLASPRCTRPADVTLDALTDEVDARIAGGHAQSFLHGLAVVPTPSGPVLALPTAPVSDHHNSRIRELLQYRHRAQLSLVRELVRP